MPSDHPKIKYRRDIDGLRAIAVLVVLFNHLRTRFSGGYIGVDVFFVISGYLISATILQEMNAGTFSIGAFYERRIRRIFPALLAMLLVCSILTYIFFVPSEIEDYARSLLAALFSVSNLLFWHQAGYFDAPSSLKPLLHTWSLAVEEQFYILFPLFLVLVRRWLPRRLKTAIWTVTALSFALACVYVRRDPTAAFFFAPLRAWELLIGTILSQRYLPAIRGSLQRNLAAAIGVLLIFVPSVLYTETTPFPGLAALPPCLGAALIIAAGETGPSLVGTLLMWRPFAFIGLISYSLYLWHWPLIVFQSTNSMLLSVPQWDKRAKYAILLLSLVIATLSWKFVETPFRKGRFRPGRRNLLLVNGCATAILAALGIIMLADHGMPGRFPPDAMQVARYSNYDPGSAFRENVCFIGPHSSWSDFRPDICLADDPTRKHDLLLGDSHAAQFYFGLSTVFPEINFSQANHSGCRSALPGDGSADIGCQLMAKFIYGDYLLHHHIDTVLLAGRWTSSDFPSLERTVSWIQQHGMKVVILGPIMEYDAPFPRVLATSLREHSPAELERHRLPDPQQTDKQLAEIARRQLSVPYISFFEDLCESQVKAEARSQPEAPSGCPLYAAPGVPILFDTDHLTDKGSIMLAAAVRARHQLDY